MKLKTLVFVLSIILALYIVLDIESLGINGFVVKEKPIPKENGSIAVYFCPRDGCEQILAGEIMNSGQVMCALYDLNLEKVKTALKSKNADVLIDEDNYEGYGQEISGSGLMHNKFCIFDNKKIFTGSFNPTERDAYKNNNNLLIIESKYLSENYINEFYELKNLGKNARNINEKIIFNGFLVENYFCPDDDCEANVLKILNTAGSSVYFMTFSFTSDPIGDFLISKKDSIDIKGVFEKSQNNDWTEYSKMKDAGMDVVFDGNSANMHHKVFIIDNETVITGSYNPSNNGNKNNDENILIIHDRTIAAEFIEEFERVWKEAQNQ
ncbi:MAG: phospholipase D-like domain-containing protein [Candidatus Woesearchaeota archaeon]